MNTIDLLRMSKQKSSIPRRIILPNASLFRCTPCLEGRQINTFVIHFGISDVLRDFRQLKTYRPLQNTKTILLKFKKRGAKNIYIVGLSYITRIIIAISEKIHVMIQNFSLLFVCRYHQKHGESVYTRMDII